MPSLSAKCWRSSGLAVGALLSPSMKSRKQRLGGGLLTWIFCLVGLMLVSGCDRSPKTAPKVLPSFVRLTNYFHLNESALTAEATALLAGKVPPSPGRTSYPVNLATNNGIHIRYAGMDRNSNVYFVSSDSWVTFNIGLAYSPHELPLLGDTFEPRLHTNIVISPKWHGETPLLGSA